MRTQKILSYIPECLILLFALLVVLSDLFNGRNDYAMIIPILLIGALLLFKNKFLAIFISILMAFGGVWMFLAALSEYHDFTIKSSEATNLLIVGTLISVLLIGIAITMPIKYLRKEK